MRSFQLLKPSARVDARDLVQLRQRYFVNACASLAQGVQRALKNLGDVGFKPVEHHAVRHGQAPGRQGCRAARDTPLRQDFVQQQRIANRAGEGTGGIERGGQRNRACRGYEPGRGFEADDAAQRCWNAQRPTRVRAKGSESRSRGHRHRRTGGGATRHPGFARQCAKAPIPGGGGAVVGVGAHAGEGKFHHVGFADEGCTRRPQPCHSGAVVQGRLGLR